MLKLSKKPEIYEVYNEWAAESVFIDHKPSKAELKELVEANDWFRGQMSLSLEKFIKKFIFSERLRHFYVRGSNEV